MMFLSLIPSKFVIKFNCSIRFFLMMVWLLFIIGLMGLFFYNKIGSIISIGDLPTTNIIEPFLFGSLVIFYIFDKLLYLILYFLMWFPFITEITFFFFWNVVLCTWSVSFLCLFFIWLFIVIHDRRSFPVSSFFLLYSFHQ